jgi:geranylgeranyl diphosphate synthase, type I
MLNEQKPGFAIAAGLSAAVDETIALQLSRVEPPELREAVMHVAFGGKRVRPLLTMLSCGAAGGNPLDALHAAAAIELLHTSSLVHDDIMDDSPLRRGVPTLHTMYGSAMAILAGDTLIALAFRLMQAITSPNKDRVLGKFTNGFLHTCEGQGYDLALSRGDGVTIERHRTMAEKKTADLMGTASSIGAMIGTTNEEHIVALEWYGRDLGMAFQAKDDLLDVVGDEKKLGKPVGNDRRNRSATFLNGGDTARSVTDPAARALGSACVARYVDSACLHLKALPDGPSRDILKHFAHHLAQRES